MIRARNGGGRGVKRLVDRKEGGRHPAGYRGADHVHDTLSCISMVTSEEPCGIQRGMESGLPGQPWAVLPTHHLFGCYSTAYKDSAYSRLIGSILKYVNENPTFLQENPVMVVVVGYYIILTPLILVSRS